MPHIAVSVLNFLLLEEPDPVEDVPAYGMDVEMRPS